VEAVDYSTILLIALCRAQRPTSGHGWSLFLTQPTLFPNSPLSGRSISMRRTTLL